MDYKDLPAGSTFRVCRKILRNMMRGDSPMQGLLVGDDSNYFQVEADGTWVNKGDSTTWDDLVTSLIGLRLSSVAGKVNYNYDENAVVFQPGGSIANAVDRVIFSMQYPHASVVDGELRLHMHMEQPDATARQFTTQYRIQNNGSAKTTSWTTVIRNTTDNVAFTYVSGTLNQIIKLAEVDMTGMGISSTIQFRLARTDSETGDILGTFVDSHVERDTHGSRQEYVK